jgi:hypothetical protein
VEPEPEPEPQPEAGPAPGPKKKKKKTKKKTSSKTTPKPEDESAAVPPPPSGSAQTAEQLLSDARKASMAGNASKAYKLAKEAYASGKSPDALQLMGVSACKMGDAAKARSAYKKLSGSKKSQLASLCSSKGIEL